MTEHHGHAASAGRYVLGEGILWDDRTQRVVWIDLPEGAVHSAPLSDRRIGVPTTVRLGQTVGAVALAEDGGLLVAGASGLVTISANGALGVGPDILSNPAESRLNDGSVDPQGRFIVGSAPLADPTGEEVLLRASADGTVETLREGIGLSNGVAFSPEGDMIYHVDTVAGTVARHSYGAHAFDRAEPWVTVVEGMPNRADGMTIDSTGDLWIAQWGGSRVQRHDPFGELLETVTIGTPLATCPAFIGPRRDLLAITSAHLNADDDNGAGVIYLADVGATGLPTPRWSGSTSRSSR